MQNHYNLVYREEEREMMPTLKVHSLFQPHPLTLNDLY
jgi:aryl-alcohol dehydrogenase-like predicted oxidoreductase